MCNIHEPLLDLTLEHYTNAKIIGNNCRIVLLQFHDRKKKKKLQINVEW